MTEGEYFRVPEGTPVLPWPHYFGSAVWDNGDFPKRTGPGPVTDAERRWTNGELLGPTPGIVPLGTASDFAQENAPDQSKEKIHFINGIPEFCYLASPDLLIDPIETAAIGSCCLTLAYARVIDLLYDEENTKVQDFITSWIGPTVTVNFYPLDGLLPARAIVYHPLFIIVFIAGTDNEEQLATQAFQGAIPPTNIAGIGTLPLWSNTANQILTDLDALGTSGEELVTITGHSYGAAVGTILAMRMRLAHSERDINLLTFASPKPCNAASMAILDTMKHRHIANYSDLVTVVPTNLAEGVMFGGIITNPIALIWGSWEPFPVSEIYLGDGTFFEDSEQHLGWNVLLPAMLRYSLGLDWSPSAFHPIKVYIWRLSLRCAGPCWPIDLASWIILFGVGTNGPVDQIIDAPKVNDWIEEQPIELDVRADDATVVGLGGDLVELGIGKESATDWINYEDGFTLGS